MFKRICVLLLTAMICAFGLEIGERLAIPGVHGIFSSAQAIIGRPLTPIFAGFIDQLLRAAITAAEHRA